MERLVQFRLDERLFALPLGRVERVLRVVAWTEVPGAPAMIMGVLDVGGTLVPLVDLRALMRLPEREVDKDDQIILAATRQRTVALLVDEVMGVEEIDPTTMVAMEGFVDTFPLIDGMVQCGDGLVLLQDLDRVLSPEEERSLEEALREFNQRG